MVIDKKRRRAQATIEYMVLTILILTTFLIFQKYIVRGFSGRWKQVGDSFASGRLYDPKKTTECVYDYQHGYGWYDLKKFEAQEGCTQACFADRDDPQYDINKCLQCFVSAKTDLCDEEN